MKRNFLISIIILFLFPLICLSQEDREAEAKKLYLEASRLVRSEDYTMAEEKLNKILDEYIDTEIALQADELLSSIMEKVKEASLPTTPGYYVSLRNGTLIELQKLRLEGSDVTFLQKDAVEIFADEFDKFYVYNPKANLSSVSWLGLSGYEAPEGQEISRWQVYQNFVIPTKQGDLTYDKLVFNEFKPGLFEIKFPDKFSPTQPFGAALTDGTPYVAVLVIHPEMVDALYPLVEFWDSGQISASDELVKPLLRKYPEKPELHLISGVIQYKQSYLGGSSQEKAKEFALNGIKAANKAENTPKQVVADLESLLGQCRTDSAIVASEPGSTDSEDQLRTKLMTLEQFDKWAVANANYRWYNAKALLYSRLGEYEGALDMCDKSKELFKEYGEKGFSFLGTKVTVQVGPEEEAKLSMQKSINNFDNDSKKRTEKLKDYIESEQILAQVENEYIQGTGDPKKGLKLIDDARGKDKHNEHAYMLRAAMYEKLGDSKNAEKAREEAEEKKLRPKEWK